MSFCNLYIGKLQTAETSPQYFVIDGSCQDFDILLTKAGKCDEWKNLNWKITTKSSVWKTIKKWNDVIEKENNQADSVISKLKNPNQKEKKIGTWYIFQIVKRNLEMKRRKEKEKIW